MADTAINALRDESMLLTYLQGDRPICTQVSVRPVEEPEADHLSLIHILTRLQELLTQNATRALPEIWDLIMLSLIHI